MVPWLYFFTWAVIKSSPPTTRKTTLSVTWPPQVKKRSKEPLPKDTWRRRNHQISEYGMINTEHNSKLMAN